MVEGKRFVVARGVPTFSGGTSLHTGASSPLSRGPIEVIMEPPQVDRMPSGLGITRSGRS